MVRSRLRTISCSDQHTLDIGSAAGWSSTSSTSSCRSAPSHWEHSILLLAIKHHIHSTVRSHCLWYVYALSELELFCDIYWLNSGFDSCAAQFRFNTCGLSPIDLVFDFLECLKINLGSSVVSRMDTRSSRTPYKNLRLTSLWIDTTILYHLRLGLF
jgi:hypothetical protein